MANKQQQQENVGRARNEVKSWSDVRDLIDSTKDPELYELVDKQLQTALKRLLAELKQVTD